MIWEYRSPNIRGSELREMRELQGKIRKHKRNKAVGCSRGTRGTGQNFVFGGF